MRALVLKNHYESTAALAWVVRREVPGIEIYGGIDLNLTVGGVNPAAVERMTMMKGGWGRVVWMPTFDAENQVRFSKQDRPFVSVARDGQLLPAVRQVIALVAKHQLTLETGHSSAEEGLKIVREARRQGVQHIVVTHALIAPVRMTIPQMQEAAKDGAYIEFVYNGLIGPSREYEIGDYARAIRAVRSTVVDPVERPGSRRGEPAPPGWPRRVLRGTEEGRFLASRDRSDVEDQSRTRAGLAVVARYAETPHFPRAWGSVARTRRSRVSAVLLVMRETVASLRRRGPVADPKPTIDNSSVSPSSRTIGRDPRCSISSDP